MLGFSFSLNNSDANGNDLGALLTFRFRARVDVTGFNPTTLVLQSNNTNSPAILYQLTDPGTFASGQVQSLTRTLTLSAADTEAIKLLSKYGFATATSNTFLNVATGSGLADLIVGTEVQRARQDNNSILAESVTVDRVAPFLTSFYMFDSNSASFTVVFNEPILMSSFNVSAVLFGKSFIDSNPIRLTSGSFTNSSDGNTMIVYLSVQDSERIQLSRLVCSAASNCFLSLETGAVTDMANNAQVAVPQGFNAAYLLLSLQSGAR